MRAYLADIAGKSAIGSALGLAEPQFTARQIALLYGISVAAVAVALVARLLLAPILGDESPYLFFVPAVLVAAGVAGLRPGLLTTLLSTLLAIFVVQQPDHLAAADIV